MRGELPPPAFVQGAGPEQDQYTAGRHSVVVGLFAGGVANGTLSGHPSRMVRFDTPLPPQAFVAHPTIVRTLEEAQLGSEAVSRLPGRLPPTAWDGEPGYSAPTT